MNGEGRAAEASGSEARAASTEVLVLDLIYGDLLANACARGRAEATSTVLAS